ncbi:hypothetical protein AB0F91_47120 [Amycolatopsis sp. NPDC023774]|uniref:hypothetical protein n=1 Tax=Amycolatopsis sp. NPDC023774 TaxID=3155015 RepID=UPI0033F6A2F5
MLTTRWVDPSDGSVAWQDDFQHILEAAEMQIDPMYRRYVAKDPTVFAFDCDAVVGVAQGHMVRDGFDAPRVWCRSRCLSPSPGRLEGLIVA